MNISRTVDLKHAVHTMALHSDDTLTVTDIDNVVRRFALEDFKLLTGFKSNVESATLHVHNAAVSADARHLLLYRPSKRELLLFDTTAKRFVYALKPHNAGTESVVFAPDNSAFVSGGVDGRIFMWSVAEGKKIDTFPHHADTVSIVAFSPDSRLIATGGYDRVIKISNRSFRNNQYRLVSHAAVPTVLIFLKELRLLSADREGTLLIWDIIASKVIKRLEKFPSSVTAATLGGAGRFLFVCGSQGEIALYDLQEEVLLDSAYQHTRAEITAVCYDDRRDRLVCGLADGRLAVFDFGARDREFASHLEAKAFARCYEMLEADPMLRCHPGTQTLETVFDTYYKGAKKLLMGEQPDKAQALMAPFSASAAKRLLTQKLFNDFKHYKRFSEAARAGKFVLAYALAEEYGDLKNTPLYEAMEQKWQAILDAAAKIPVTKEYESRLRELFRPYLGVTGKNTLMNILYANGATVQRFQNLIGNKEYAEAFKLVASNAFLQNLDEYRQLMRHGELLEQTMHDAFRDGKYPEAVNLSDDVALFPGRAETAATIRERGNIYATAMSYYAEKKLGDVYNIIERHPYLADTEIGGAVEAVFKEAMREAEARAARCDVAAIKEAMSEFMGVRSKIPAIVHIIKVAYLGQIERLCEKQYPALNQAITRYMNYFGYDEMLDDALSQIEERCPFTPAQPPEAKAYEGAPDRLPERLY